MPLGSLGLGGACIQGFGLESGLASAWRWSFQLLLRTPSPSPTGERLRDRLALRLGVGCSRPLFWFCFC